MALDDMMDDHVPEDDQVIPAEDICCPACGGTEDDINVINKSMYNCENDACAVYNFGRNTIPPDENDQ